MPMDFGGFQKNHARNQVYVEFGIQTLMPSFLPTPNFTTMPETIRLEACYVEFTENRGLYRRQNEDISPPEITDTSQARALLPDSVASCNSAQGQPQRDVIHRSIPEYL